MMVHVHRGFPALRLQATPSGNLAKTYQLHPIGGMQLMGRVLIGFQTGPTCRLIWKLSVL